MKALSRGLLIAALLAAMPMVVPAQSRADDYIVMILCDGVPGREIQFNVWWPGYLQTLASAPGVTSVEVFRRAAARLRDGAQPLPAHMAYLSVSAADFSPVARELDRRTGQGREVTNPAVDPRTIRVLRYRREGDWKGQAPSATGDRFLQIVLSNALTGQDGEYRRWFQQTHGPHLSAVPGVYEVEFATRLSESIPGRAAASPLHLSAMRFRTTSIMAFKEGLDLAAAQSTSPIATYDIAGSWRETYERTGDVLRGPGR